MSIELILVAGIAVIGLVVSCVCLANVSALRRELRKRKDQPASSAIAGSATTPGAMESGNVFCRECGQMYDSMDKACPFCHTPRG